MNVIQKIEKEQMKDEVANFDVGDQVKVHTRVVEGGKERIQIFAGIVLAKKGAGVGLSFTVRKISYGEGVERVFPVHSPRIAKIEVTQRGRVRRARLHYLRDRVGKQATQVKAARDQSGLTAGGRGRRRKKKQGAEVPTDGFEESQDSVPEELAQSMEEAAAAPEAAAEAVADAPASGGEEKA
jgi:large subunit ribosomal protein L19